MIECHICGHQELEGTICCSECGSRLVDAVAPIGQPGPRQGAASGPGPHDQPTSATVDWQAVTSVGLRIVNTQEELSLMGRNDYTLGVAVEGQAIIPDIDLSRFEAYNHGVSRIHAEIRLQADGAYIIDLDSANGTLINGKRIEAQVPTALQPGDIFQLGTLPLQLIDPQGR